MCLALRSKLKLVSSPSRVNVQSFEKFEEATHSKYTTAQVTHRIFRISRSPCQREEKSCTRQVRKVSRTNKKQRLNDSVKKSNSSSGFPLRDATSLGNNRAY